MNILTKQSNILHLHGITMKDFISVEDTFDKKILEVIEKKNNTHKIYDKIPTIFTSVKEWPTTTNLRCWSCTFTFDGPPCFIPTFVRIGQNNNIKIGVEGNFCTFNCAARYIDDIYSPQAGLLIKNWKMKNNLCLVYYYFKKININYIKPAIKKTELIIFGGTYTKDEFWANLRSLDPLNELNNHNNLNTNIVTLKRTPVIGKTIWNICNKNIEVVQENKIENEEDLLQYFLD